MKKQEGDARALADFMQHVQVPSKADCGLIRHVLTSQDPDFFHAHPLWSKKPGDKLQTLRRINTVCDYKAFTFTDDDDISIQNMVTDFLLKY